MDLAGFLAGLAWRDVERANLFGEDQLAVAGETKPVFRTVVQQHDFPPGAQQVRDRNARNGD